MDSRRLNEKIKKLYPFVNQIEFPLPEDGMYSGKTRTIKFKYGDFTFGRILGKQVQEAAHLQFNIKMAMKFVPLFIALENDQNKISEKISEKFKEVTVLRELSKHENIVDFYGFCLHKENLLICMEVMDMSLRELASHAHKQYGYFPQEWLGVITVSVIKALRFCRAKRVLHRDLKPDNILVDKKKGQVKLADFGVCGILSETSHLTTVKGTILYWPPERFKPLEKKSLESEKYDERADIWSLGLTLCQLVYNDVPYNKTTNEMSEIEKTNAKREKTEAEKYIDLQQQIRSETSEGLINRCFQQNKDRYPDPNTKDFIKLCLNPYEDRPKLEELENTNFYEKYVGVDSIHFALELPEVKDSTLYQSNEDRTDMYATFDTYKKACYIFISGFIVYLIEGEKIKHGILSDLTSRFLYTMFYAVFVNTFSTLWVLVLMLKYFVKENVKKEYALNEEQYVKGLQLFLRITIIFTPFMLLDNIYNTPWGWYGVILFWALSILWFFPSVLRGLYTRHIYLSINRDDYYFSLYMTGILIWVVCFYLTGAIIMFASVDPIKKFHTTGTQHGMRDLLDLIHKDNNGGFLVISVIMYMAMIICAIFFDIFSFVKGVIAIVKIIFRCTSTPTNATNLQNDNTDERRNLLEKDSLLANEEKQEETRIQIEDPEQPQNSEQFMDPEQIGDLSNL